MPLGAGAHSGRTDANGGHKDNKNVSGLGSYHYHCGGHEAHLHPNGVCPYASSASSSSSGSSGAVSSKSSSGTSSGTSSAHFFQNRRFREYLRRNGFIKQRSSGAFDDAYQAGYDAAKADFNEEKQTLTEEAYEKGKTEAQNEIDSLQEENDQLKTEIQQEQSSSGSAGAAAGILGLLPEAEADTFLRAGNSDRKFFPDAFLPGSRCLLGKRPSPADGRRRGRHRYSSVRAPSVFR